MSTALKYLQKGDRITDWDKLTSHLFDPYKYLVLAIIFLCVCGIVILYSIGYSTDEDWALKQLITFALFLFVMYVIQRINVRYVYNMSYLIYIVALIFLIAAHFFGHKAMGAQRWIRIGPINFQPSEFMKLATVLFLARYYYDIHGAQQKLLKTHIVPILGTIVPALIVLKQPNLGTALILCGIGVTIFFLSGIRRRIYLAGFIGVVVLMPLIYSMLHDYQKQRVQTFLNPETDSLGAGYNILQSKIAIGSGGIFGKGYLNGSQNQLRFLPEKQTDFVFAVFAEEFGFVGVLVVFIDVMVILFLSLIIAYQAQNHFMRLIIMGVSMMFFLHFFINTMMISGLLPTVGIPFPFMSYGGSSLAVMMASFGFVLNRTKL